MMRRARILAGLLVLSAMVSVAGAGRSQQLPSASLASIFPTGAKQGTTVDVTIAGVDLDDCGQLVFSNPGITAAAKLAPVDPILGEPRPVPGAFTVTIAADAPLGRHEVRALGRYGLTNPRSFIVGNSAEIVEAGGNNAFATAAPAELGAIVNGRCEGGASDYYKVALKGGQRFLADCSAWRIDSRLRPVISLHDGAGKRLAQSSDQGEGDALLDFTPAADGDCVVKLHDFTFDGGPDYFYRLQLGAGAIVESVFPPAGQPGVPTTFTLLGRNLPGGQVASGLTAGNSPLEQVTVQLTLPGEPIATSHPGATRRLDSRAAPLPGYLYSLDTPSGPARPVMIGQAATAPTIEQDANDSPSQAQKLAAPMEVAGRFYPARDKDWIAFDAKAGESYWIEVISHRAGVQSDAYFTIESVTRNEKGEEAVSFVAEVDDPADRGNFAGAPVDLTSNDPSYKLDVGADATYRIMLRDLAGDARRDARTSYRLIVRPAKPDFQLVATPTDATVPANPNAALLGAIALRRGESVTADVFVERIDGFAGDVEVTVEGLPAGVTCPPAIVGSAMKSAALVFTATEGAAAWAGPLRIVGKARIGDPVTGAETLRVARAGSLVWGSQNFQAQDAQSRLTGDLTLAVLDKEVAPATIVLGETGKVFETSRGGTIDIPVKMTRRGEYKADVALAPIGLHNDLKPNPVTIAGAAADGVLQVVVNNTNVAAGTYTFRLQVDSKFNYARNPEAAARAAEDQKKVDAAIAERTEKNRLAQEAKNAAVANAANAAAALQAAQQAKAAADAEATSAAAAIDGATAPDAKAAAEAASAAAKEKVVAADKALADATTASQSADEAKVAAEKTAAEAEASLKQATDLKPSIDQKLNETKAAAAPKEVNFRLVSTPLTLKIAATPVKYSISAPAANIKQGEKGAATIKVERLYGFADQVDFTLEPPSDVAGLAGALSLPNGQGEGNMEITAAPDATPGEHTAIVRARMKFNNISLETTETIKIVVEKVEPAAAQ